MIERSKFVKKKINILRVDKKKRKNCSVNSWIASIFQFGKKNIKNFL